MFFRDTFYEIYKCKFPFETKSWKLYIWSRCGSNDRFRDNTLDFICMFNIHWNRGVKYFLQLELIFSSYFVQPIGNFRLQSFRMSEETKKKKIPRVFLIEAEKHQKCFHRIFFFHNSLCRAYHFNDFEREREKKNRQNIVHFFWRQCGHDCCSIQNMRVVYVCFLSVLLLSIMPLLFYFHCQMNKQICLVWFQWKSEKFLHFPILLLSNVQRWRQRKMFAFYLHQSELEEYRKSALMCPKKRCI